MNEILSAASVILSLILIEGLLSVDNAMAIAAMASGLPEKQRVKALRYGIIGAYAMRGLAMVCASWISGNVWVKGIGAAYLLYLMCSQMWGKDSEDGAVKKSSKGFLATVIAIEFMDLSLSLDNVVAAVALDSRIWVICTGVFIGILILRFVAGFCIRLIEKHPVLNNTAFLLVGFVGIMLLVEITLNVHLTAWVKAGGIFSIVGLSLIYERNAKPS